MLKKSAEDFTLENGTLVLDLKTNKEELHHGLPWEFAYQKSKSVKNDLGNI